MNFREFLKDVLGYLAIVTFAALIIVAIMLSPSNALATTTSSNQRMYTHPLLVYSTHPPVYYSGYTHFV